MKDKIYYGYIRDVWSKDFKKTIGELSKLDGLTFLLKKEDRILFQIFEKDLDKIIHALSNSVRDGAWHDLASSYSLVVIFSPTDVRRISLNVSESDATWLKMKELEPSVRKYATVKKMIYASEYGRYLSMEV